MSHKARWSFAMPKLEWDPSKWAATIDAWLNPRHSPTSCAVCKSKPQGCDCDIPPPPWYPQLAGEVDSYVCEGGVATVRLRITNCGPQRRTIQVKVTPGDEYGTNEVEPQQVALEPFDDGHVVVRVKLKPETPEHISRKIWIRGCKLHMVCWTIHTHPHGVDACHELVVSDGPDYIHHWYDHFYCNHPCLGSKTSAQG